MNSEYSARMPLTCASPYAGLSKRIGPGTRVASCSLTDVSELGVQVTLQRYGIIVLGIA
jgi:hypothetical protein